MGSPDAWSCVVGCKPLAARLVAALLGLALLLGALVYVRPEARLAVAKCCLASRYVVAEPQAEGRFVYLVTGHGLPGQVWRQLAWQDGVHVLFAAWDYSPDKSIIAKYRRLVVLYYPDSTWSSTRNFLYQKAVALEKTLDKPFDYFLFADEDVRLGRRTHDNPGFLITEDSLPSSLLLHKQLLRDKPARASVEYPAGYYSMDEFPVQCVLTCAFDGALDIFHRSIAPFLLPYSLKFEALSWPMSQYIMNLRAQALADEYCHLYRNLFIDPDNNGHKSYPTDYELLANASVFVADCLADRGLQYTTRSGESDKQARWRALRRPTPTQDTTQCSRQAPDVDYSHVLQSILKIWPRECH